jgi:hypothetical protein
MPHFLASTVACWTRHQTKIRNMTQRALKNQQAIRATCGMATPPEEKKTFMSYPFG